MMKLQRIAGQRPQQGMKSCRMGRNSVRPSICPSVCPPLAGPQTLLADPQTLLAGPQTLRASWRGLRACCTVVWHHEQLKERSVGDETFTQ